MKNLNDMNKYLKIIMISILFCGAVSCNRDEVFDREQYKNVFALVSGTDNVSNWVHDLRKTESEGYVSASLGGSNPSAKDIRVSLVEDARLIDAYNVTTFDVNTSRYIQPLARSKYSIDQYEFTIPAGETRGSIPVRIRPEGLSPDSSYFIALKVDTYSAYEVNPDKDYMLYQVQIKNWWAAYGGTVYNQRGNQKEEGSTYDPIQIFGSKRIYPLSPTSVRVLAGTELNDYFDIEIFKKYSMTLTIGNDNSIQITPYKNLEIEPVDDPDFPNMVVLEDDGFKTYKTFLLSYAYKASDGKTYFIREELRLEYRDDPQDPRVLNN